MAAALTHSEPLKGADALREAERATDGCYQRNQSYQRKQGRLEAAVKHCATAERADAVWRGCGEGGRAEALSGGGDATTRGQTAAVAGKASLKLRTPPKRLTRCWGRLRRGGFGCGGFEWRRGRTHPRTNCCRRGEGVAKAPHTSKKAAAVLGAPSVRRIWMRRL